MAPSGDRPRRDQRPGVRLGPMVFVSGLSTTPNDPWAHRKGEPRLFTLLWAIYLLLGAMGTIFATRTIGPPTSTSYRAGCLAMLAVVAAGATILWPAVRLSQGTPSRPIRSVLIDLGVILLPIQSVVWPMPMLTRWPWDVTAAMVMVITGWVVLIGAVVAQGVMRPVGIGRAARMALVCIAIIGGPAVGVIGSARGWWNPTGGMLTSPITAGWALAGTPPNLRPSMTGLEWAACIAPCLAAAVAWVLISLRPSRSIRPSHP